jgi:uncharacterized RDD family membrane protein YckC
VTVRLTPDRDISLQGHYAGVVTRLAAFGIDVLVATTLFTLGGSVVEYLVSSLLGKDVSLSDAPVVSIVALTVWLLVYFAYPVAVGGRTLGMAVVGLEVVSKDGGDVDAKHAVLRTLCLPVSLILLAIGVLMVLVRRDRRALHDLIAGTAVVYSWDARAARLRFLAGRSPQWAVERGTVL